MSVLAAVEACYDAIPRAAGEVEDVGPFTLFRADPASGWQFYARPRLGLTAEISADDVRRVLARQQELGLPGAVEWVDEVTPSLRRATTEAAPGAIVEECPLFVLPADVDVLPADGPGRYPVTAPDDDDLPLVLGAVDGGFRDSDDVPPVEPGVRPRLMASGDLVVVAAYDEHGRAVGGGSAAPRSGAAELMGIAVVPAARGRGHGSAITRALVVAARAAGARTVFLSAASEGAAGVYRRVGFERVGTAMILSTPSD